MTQGLTFLIPLVGIVASCAALGVSRASYYRSKHPPMSPTPRPRPARALSDEERTKVLAVLDSERHGRRFDEATDPRGSNSGESVRGWISLSRSD